MDSTKKFKLVDGTFNVDDAKDILLGLFEYKIQFHKRNKISNEERFGMQDEHSKTRAKELQMTKDEILDWIKSLQHSDKKLVINSSITVETEDELIEMTV